MSEEETQGQGSAADAAPKKSRSGLGRILLVIIILAVIAGAVYFLMSGTNGAVALVNNQKITQGQYNDYYAQVSKLFESQGQDVANTDVQATMKKQAIDDLILEALVLQEAEKEGISADMDAVNSQYDASKQQFADEAAFNTALAEQGFTPETFKSTLTKQNIFQQYIGTHVDLEAVEVTDDEAADLYEQIKALNSELSPYEEITEQIRAEALRQKQQFLITQFVQGIRDQSDIEILAE